MKKGVKIFLIIVAVLTIIVVGAYLMMKKSADDALSSIVYEDVDMSQTNDGTYFGETDGTMVYAKVAVTIENHEIKKIEIIEHRNGRGAKAEAITDTIVAENSYDVDDVSGATFSSKVIKSAVSKALKESYNSAA